MQEASTSASEEDSEYEEESDSDEASECGWTPPQRRGLRKTTAASTSAHHDLQNPSVEAVPASAVMPDPTDKPAMLELGTLRLPFEVIPALVHSNQAWSSCLCMRVH